MAIKRQFSYMDYAWEIFTVAEKLPCGLGEAWDRFRADVEAGQAKEYNTGELLPEMDFARAKRAWDALHDRAQEKVRAAWRRLVENRDRVLVLLRFYREDDREGFGLAVELWRRGLEGRD